MTFDTSISVGGRTIAIDQPTYFIADIAANHDGDIGRAKDLIWLAKEAGADVAKFQHFTAGNIVSDVGFSDDAVGKVSHQAKWNGTVSQIYDRYHTRREWTAELVETAREAKIELMTTPYDVEAVDLFAGISNAFKVGSGDITFLSLLARIADAGKPVFLATGAATMEEVERAVATCLARNRALCLMQCNTNYTGSRENFAFVNLNVLKAFASRWPGMPLGFSDHTPGHSAVLGAVTLGARVVEKHFTDDNNREGPDHSFALNPQTWRDMVDATRELELALGDGVKRIEGNEEQTVVIQRRALRARRDLAAGERLGPDCLEALRPCPEGAVDPARLGDITGRALVQAVSAGQEIRWTDLV